MIEEGCLMRGNIIRCIVVAVFLIIVGVCCSKCEVHNLSDEPHVYEVLPGTPEWESMTPSQRQESCEVSVEEVESMTTAALVETVISYPYLIDIYAFDTLEQGIEWVSMYFLGLPELLSREDAIDELQKYQIKMKEQISNEDNLWKIEDANTLEKYIQDYIKN